MVMVEQQHKFITGTKLYTYMAIIGKCICVCVRMHACVYFFFSCRAEALQTLCNLCSHCEYQDPIAFAAASMADYPERGRLHNIIPFDTGTPSV